MSTNTGGPAFPLAASTGDPRDGVYCQNGMTLLDWYAGQALAGLCSSWYDRHKDDPLTQRGHGPRLISQSAYTHAEAMLAEKARREATGKDSLTVPDHSPDATKMIWKQSPNMGSAIVCETQFSDEHADDENVKAYGGFLVAESVPEEAKALIIRAPQLEAANRELVEAFDGVLKMLKEWHCDFPHEVGDKEEDATQRAQSLIAKHKGAA